MVILRDFKLMSNVTFLTVSIGETPSHNSMEKSQPMENTHEETQGK